MEESIFAVHMGTVEKSITVHDFVPVIASVLRVVIFLILDVKFVTGDIFAREFLGCWQNLARLAVLLEA